MHMVEPGIWQGGGTRGRDCVPVHFHALALDARTGPPVDIYIDLRPYIVCGDEPLGGSDAWV